MFCERDKPESEMVDKGAGRDEMRRSRINSFPGNSCEDNIKSPPLPLFPMSYSYKRLNSLLVDLRPCSLFNDLPAYKSLLLLRQFAPFETSRIHCLDHASHIG